jgi:hypothetical protein
MELRSIRSFPSPRLPVFLLSGLLLGVPFAVLLGGPAVAAEPLQTGPTHRGVVTVGNYQIFPENRAGNGIYADNVLMLSLPGQTLLDVGNLPPKGRFVYMARQGETRTVGVRGGANDPPPRVTEVSPGYFYVVTVLDGAAYKKLYRVQGATLTDLLPLSKTADGVTVGEKGILFFHIGKADEPDGANPTFAIGVHLAVLGEARVRHLPKALQNTLPTLKMKWLDDARFEFTLADGTSETLNTSQFQ